MTYISGTITNSDPGVALYALVDTAALAAGYTLVDTVVIGARTHKVYKSAAANNLAGKDWYLDVAYTTVGAGHLWFTPFEDYVAATDLALRGPINLNGFGTGATPEATYWSKTGATGYALESAQWDIAAGNTRNQVNLTATAFGYWISITTNRVIAMTSNAATKPMYVGLFKPHSLYTATVGADLFPLVTMEMASSIFSYQSGALNRYPRGTGNQHYPIPGVLTASLAFPAIPSGAEVVTKRAAVGIPIQHNPFGYIGEFYDTALVNASGSVTRGDTVTADGNTWVLSSPVTVASQSLSTMFRTL